MVLVFPSWNSTYSKEYANAISGTSFTANCIQSLQFIIILNGGTNLKWYTHYSMNDLHVAVQQSVKYIVSVHGCVCIL